MTEYDPAIRLTFGNKKSAYNFLDSLDACDEQIIWEQNVTDNGQVVVRILNIIDPTEEVEEDE